MPARDNPPTTHPVESFEFWILNRRRFIVAGVAMLLVLYNVRAILDFGVAIIDGVTYFILDDDIMISMRYARNFARGAGLVYNEGEYVEGFTNPLLTLIATGLHLLPVPLPTVSLGLMLVNIGFSLSIVYILTRFWGEHGQDSLAGLFAAMFYVTLPNHSWHAHAGYEVYMFMAILLFSIWRIEHLRVTDALIMGLLPLTHSIALGVWAILVASIFFLTEASAKQRFFLAVVTILPFSSYELFRILYYQDFLPNTAWLKVGAGSLKGGLVYAKDWLNTVIPVAILAVYTLFTSRDKKTILLGILLVSHTGAVVVLGGDIFYEYRFLFPCSLLLAALAGRSVSVLLKRAVALSKSECAYLCVLVAGTMMYVMVWLPFHHYRMNIPEFEFDKRWQVRQVAMGLALRENTAPRSIIALFGLGHEGYYSERHVIDMLGKADRHIAHTKSTPNRHIGHSKTDFDYVMGLSPDYISLGIPPCKLSDTAALERQSKMDLYGYTADLALHPTFRNKYAPRVFDKQGRFIPIYAKSDTGRLVWDVSESYYRNLEPNAQRLCTDAGV